MSGSAMFPRRGSTIGSQARFLGSTSWMASGLICLRRARNRRLWGLKDRYRWRIPRNTRVTPSGANQTGSTHSVFTRRPRGSGGPEPAPGMNRGPQTQYWVPRVPAFEVVIQLAFISPSSQITPSPGPSVHGFDPSAEGPGDGERVNTRNQPGTT